MLISEKGFAVVWMCPPKIHMLKPNPQDDR